MPLRINGQEVEDGIIEGEFAQIKSHFERIGNVSCCERDEEFRGYAKHNVIARQSLTAQGCIFVTASVAEARALSCRTGRLRLRS